MLKFVTLQSKFDHPKMIPLTQSPQLSYLIISYLKPKKSERDVGDVMVFYLLRSFIPHPMDEICCVRDSCLSIILTVIILRRKKSHRILRCCY